MASSDNQTSLQRKAVESVLNAIRHFLANRYTQVRRINPKAELVWDDLQWQLLANLKVTLSGDKAFGATRYHVAETLLGDDLRKSREFFSAKSQQSLLGEIVEEKESDAHRTAGTLEIHDMRSLFRRIDPSLESIATLLQTFIWWDLEDAALLARFEKKTNMVAAFEKQGITPEMAAYYQDILGMSKRPEAGDVILHELKMMQQSVDFFRIRRDEEKAYQIIIVRERSAAENPDMLIDAIAGQQQMLKALKASGTVEESARQQFAKALKCEPDAVTPERATPFLENMLSQNRERLKVALSSGGTGNPYNLKLKMLKDLEEKFKVVVGDRQLNDPSQG
ncbi:MAG: hypothetical protein JJU11_13660 [Candidatus Sumerlaeia bacterium]|nr:hypothetical protein [Candidatus Sumerlaeia bacterium]